MRVYITSQGSRVCRESRHLLVRKGDETKQKIFMHMLNQLVVFGNVEITPSARNMLFRHQVDTVFLRQDGRYVGRFGSMDPKNIFLRQKQFALALSGEFCLRFARQVVLGKMANMLVLLNRLARTRSAPIWKDKAGELKVLLGQAARADSIPALRGYEGRAGAVYFGVFGKGFNQDQGFGKRVRRPPTDPVNALLSLLYTFLSNLVYSAVQRVGLEPYIGALHTPEYGRYSLVLDLMEEFRPVVVDSLVLSLFNKGILNREEDFLVQQGPLQSEKSSDSNETKLSLGEQSTEELPLPNCSRDGEKEGDADREATLPVRLTPEAMKKVISHFESKLEQTVIYGAERRKMSYAEIIVAQANHYRKLVEGSVDCYQPLILK